MKNFLDKFDKVMEEHGLTIPQTYTILSMACGNDVQPTADMYAIFIQKRLLNATGVNEKVLFRNQEEVTETVKVDIKYTEPKGNDFSITVVNKLADLLIPEKEREYEVLEQIASKYFKGDLGVAKYYNLFKWCFPRKSHTKYYELYKCEVLEDNRWDSSARVAERFHKCFIKYDIGDFFQGLHLKNITAIDKESRKTFMCGPRKFLNDCDQWVEEGHEILQKETKC